MRMGVSFVREYASSMIRSSIITFNVQRTDGPQIGYAKVEKSASVKDIRIQVRGTCNPGGIG